VPQFIGSLAVFTQWLLQHSRAVPHALQAPEPPLPAPPVPLVPPLDGEPPLPEVLSPPQPI
jgi:hypothetical protein